VSGDPSWALLPNSGPKIEAGFQAKYLQDKASILMFCYSAAPPEGL
jgi:hypothetical protein